MRDEQLLRSDRFEASISSYWLSTDELQAAGLIFGASWTALATIAAQIAAGFRLYIDIAMISAQGASSPINSQLAVMCVIMEYGAASAVRGRVLAGAVVMLIAGYQLHQLVEYMKDDIESR